MSIQQTRPAALYVRGSSEHQNYSTEHQEAALRSYAAANNYEIVAIYRDEGRSGLTMDGRTGLLALIDIVTRGKAPFIAVLIYDVSRWGRFQDSDESAYYEFACRRVGMTIAYCAEPFLNDGSAMGAVIKSLKRAMAAEYSRELSTKVLLAQCRFVLAGFKQGGSAGYGLRRLAVTATGEPRHMLAKGQHKSTPTDRVTYVRGPEHEVVVVLRIYAMYIEEKLTEVKIANRLNGDGLLNEQQRPWSAHNVKSILTREKYAGTIVFNRSTQHLRSTRRPNDFNRWVRYPGAFEGIVTPARFEAAMAERRRRRRTWSDDEMLDGLRQILVDHGKVTPDLIAASDLPAAKSYAFRFDGLVAAYEAAGVAGVSVSRASITRLRSRCITKDSMADIERNARTVGADLLRIGKRTYRVNDVIARVLVTRCRFERSHPCWKIMLRHALQPDFIIWLRLNESNERVAQVYLLPVEDFPDHLVLWPSTRTLHRYEQYARRSIPALFGLA